MTVSAAASVGPDSAAANARIASGNGRLRRDLRAIVLDQDGRRQTLVVDAIARRYTRLDSVRWEQLQRGGHRDQELDPQLMTEAAAAGLLRYPTRRAARRPGRLASLLAIRLPGVPADRIAVWLASRSGWLFSPAAVVCWLLVIAMAGLAIPIYWERFCEQLPRLRVFLGRENWLALALTLALTKLLHELAHATVCRRSGARCGTIGIMLLCGVPCPYCDVTDSWAVASRLRRAAIMLAGIYVELILAALASLVWWFTDDGAMHYAAMNVMVVCGASSLLFNLNPLMRYDGYHVLSDMLGSVQLREEASEAFGTLVTRRLAGAGYPVASTWSPRAVGLAVYHLAATAYRLFVTVLIAIWIVHIADSLSLRNAGVAAASGVLLAVPANALRKITTVVRGQGRWTGVPWARRFVLGAALLGLLLAACFVDLPRSIEARGVVDAADATAVYLPAAARIRVVDADWGQRVKAGQRLLLLSDPELQVQNAALTGQADVLRLRMTQLRRRAIDEPQLLRQWDTHLAAVQSLAAQQTAAQQACERLSVAAPCDGFVLPPPPKSLLYGATGGGAIAGDAGAADAAAPVLLPLSDPRANECITRSLHAATGASATADALWCRIGDPRRLRVVLEVDAAQRRLVRVGDVVRIRCDQSPQRVLGVRVESIETVDRRHDEVLSSESRFRVACQLPGEAASGWRIGATATARIRLPAQPLVGRLTDWWQETFGDR